MRDDLFGLFWEDAPPAKRGGERVLGPIPAIPETGWRPTSPSDLPDLRDAPVISFDTETYDPELNDYGPGWARHKGHICGFSLAVPGRSLYIPIRHTVQSEYNMDADKMLQYARHCLGGRGDKVGANLIYDVGWFREEGVPVKGRLMDVQFAEALINSTSKLGLDELATKYTGVGKDTDILKEWIMGYYGGGVKTWRKDIYRAPVTLVGAYGERDASAPLDVIMKQLPILQERGLMDLFSLENRLIPLLIDMRYAGVTVDIPYAERLQEEFQQKETELQHKLNAMVGFDVSINNAGDTLTQAFNKLGLTYPRTEPSANFPDGKPSFTKEFLKFHTHEFPKLVTEIRDFAKLRGTFVEGYLLGSHVNGKVFGSFHPLSGTDGGARTGRFASSDPNLQNIPSRTEDGKKIRKAFVKDAGHFRWEKFDYSQIEYRFLAHFAVGAGSDDIRAAYLANPKTDYHNSTAALIKSVTGIELIRSYVKNINFGLAYGMGIDKLANDLGVTVQRARELSDAYHKGVPFARETIKMLSDFAARHGYVQTILGRRNYFDLWEPEGRGRKGEPLPYNEARYAYGSNIVRAYLYRTLNYLLQGSSADQMKLAMVTAYENGIFDVTGVPRLTIHDELDFSMPDPCEEAVAELMHTMQNVIPLRVPVVAEREVGESWGGVEKLAA